MEFVLTSDHAFLKSLVSETLIRGLTAREERVIRLRFGMGTWPHTLREIADEFGITSSERIRQVEAKALRKLKHPARGSKLKPFHTFGV